MRTLHNLLAFQLPFGDQFVDNLLGLLFEGRQPSLVFGRLLLGLFTLELQFGQKALYAFPTR